MQMFNTYIDGFIERWGWSVGIILIASIFSLWDVLKW
jgi:hypothetical protein